MKTSSAKAKGRRASAEVKKLIHEFTEGWLQDGDIMVTPSGVTGRDITFSPLASMFMPYAIEVKNVEKLNVREAFKQACAHVKGDEKPVLFHTRNRDEMLVTMRAKDFLEIGIRRPQNINHAPERSIPGGAPGLQIPGEEKGD